MLDLRRLSVAAVAAAAVGLLTGCGGTTTYPSAIADPRRGGDVILRGACGSCHVIPGIPLANSQTGPSLAGVGGRAVIGGVLANTRDHLAQWLEDPQRFAPGSAMPKAVLSRQDARDAAAYLETLRTGA
jgi:cytochrome c